MSRQYRTDNTVIAIAGNVDEGKLPELLERHFGRFDRRGGGTKPVPPVFRGDYIYHHKQTEQHHLCLSFPGCPIGDPKLYAMVLLNNALGGGMSSRLFQEVREKRGLAYAVYTTAQAYEDNGTFALYAGTRPENIGKVLEVCREQIDDVAQHGISKEELHRACELSCGNFVLGMESPRSHMLYLGGRAVLGTEMPSIEETLERFRSVTVDDVSREANAILTQEPCLAVISPYGKEEIERMLAS
jgi:predicted Zn-dependent peptidase